MSKKIGLCLSGGGARGPYQVGAVKTLEELGILDKVEVFSGTSIGSANMSVIASRGVEYAKRVWFEMPEENLPKNPKTKKRRFDLNHGIYSMHVFEETMDNAIDYATLKNKEAYITVSACGQPDKGFLDVFKAQFQHYIKKESQVHYLPVKELTNEQIKKAITASCSIPILFPPVTIKEKKCYDGGVFDNTPIKPLLEAGCDEIIIIHLHKRYFVRPKIKDERITLHQIKHTKGSLGSVLNFDKNHFRKLVDLGYEDTMNYFKNKNGSELY